MSRFRPEEPELRRGRRDPCGHTCDGQDISPALCGRAPPQVAISFALIVERSGRRGFIHWAVYKPDWRASGGLPEGVGSSAPPEGLNDFGRVGYGGPCPRVDPPLPFTLYASRRRCY